MKVFGILDIEVSIQRFCADFVLEMREEISPTLTYYNFDSRNDLSELPKNDLFGGNGFAFDEESGGFITIATAFVSATNDDRNGFRHMQILHALHQKLRPGRRLPMYDHDTGEFLVDMLVTQASLGPTSRSEVRPMQAYALTLLPTTVSGV